MRVCQQSIFKEASELPIQSTKETFINALTPKPIDQAAKEDVIIGVTFTKPVQDYKTDKEIYVPPIYGEAHFCELEKRFVYRDMQYSKTRVTHFLHQVLLEEYIPEIWEDYI